MSLVGERLMTNIHRFDVSPLLPVDWEVDVERALRSRGRRAVLSGQDPSSHESSGTNLEYTLIDGIGINSHIPWLRRLYETDLLHLAEQVSSLKLRVGTDPRSSINVNVLATVDERYEWHVDTNPLTGLLFLSDIGYDQGGELAFRHDGFDILIQPRAGHFLVFDARRLVHSVLPLRANVARVSAPMNYFTNAGQELSREALDNYLYEERRKENP